MPLFWAVLPLGVVTVLADAEEPVSTGTLSLANSIACALENNPEIQMAIRGMEEAKSRFEERKTKNFPRLLAQADLERGSGPASDALNFNQARLSLIQPLYTGGRIRGEVNKNQALLGSARSEVQEIRNDIVSLVKRTYFEILATRQIVEVLREGIVQLEKDHALVENRLKARSVIPLDLLRTEAALSHQKQDLIEAQSAQRLAEIKFNRLLGRDPQESVQLEDPGPLPAGDLEPLEEYLHRAEVHRGALS
ncbi:MAG: TolC family protein [Elusimicrobia bacterium]|nr:TolC family protein [Elusimicrobiota bacterium]